MSKENFKGFLGHLKTFWLYYLFILMETVLIILYSQLTTYGTKGTPSGQWDDSSAQIEIFNYFPFLSNINVLIFIGFGFLLTVVRGFGWSAVGLNFVIGALTIQWAILCLGFWERVISNNWSTTILLGIRSFIDADYAVWSVLISFGAVYGKLNFIQYLIMAFFHTIFFSLSWMVTRWNFVANDLGGSMNVHAFGAFYGLAVSIIAGRKEAKKQSSYYSYLFAFVGTLFLWIYFPSFNAGYEQNSIAKLRAVLNTIIALTSSCVTTCLFSHFIKKERLHITYILNATLAGGVIIASSASIIIQPWVPFFLGAIAGVISVLGYEYVVPCFGRVLKIQDSAGVLSLHGITGVLGGLISAVVAGTADYTKYGNSLYSLFPAIYNGRTQGHQGGYQLATLALVLSLSIAAGVLVGLLLIIPCFTKIKTPFDDEELWIVDEDLVAEYKKSDGLNHAVEIKNTDNVVEIKHTELATI